MRDEGNVGTGLDGDVSIDAFDAFRCFIVGAVAGAAYGFRTLIGGIEKCISTAEREAPEGAVEINLSALTTSFTEVLEIAEAGLGGGNEEDVVAVISAEPAGVPMKAAFL